MAGTYLVAYNRTRGRELAGKVEKAADPASRSRGLLGRDGLAPGEGMWIVPCPMIHTFFMRFAIDALFLDRQGRVVRVCEDMRPWRLSPWVFRAHSVLELPSGALKDAVAVGDVVEFK